MSAVALSAFFMTILMNELIPGPVLILVLTRTANSGRLAGLSTVLGILVAQIMTFSAALAAIAWSLEMSGDTRFSLRAAGMALLLWLAWRLWNTPQSDPSDIANVPTQFILNDGLKGLLVGISSPYSLFLMFGLLPTLIAPTDLGTDQIILLSAAVLVATCIPLAATIWAGVALHQVCAQHCRFFARTGAIVMLGSAWLGLLSFH